MAARTPGVYFAGKSGIAAAQPVRGSARVTDEAKRRIKIRAAVFTAYAIVPAWCVAVMWFSGLPWSASWWEAFACGHVLLAGLVYAGNWSWVGTPLRWIFPAALIGAAYHTAGAKGAGLSLAALGVLIGLPLFLAHASAPASNAVHLALPFREGLFYVGQGGASRMLNHHHALRPQRFALDLLRLTPLRMRCHGFYPPVLARYAIFGTEIVSPCDGVVTHVFDELPDLIPPKADRKNLAGNHILIRCDNMSETFVLLAHLQQSSAVVKKGDRLRAGQSLARVGNSGNTTEPHLHIQIKKGGKPNVWSDGVGAPMVFAGRFLIRGDAIGAAAAVERKR